MHVNCLQFTPISPTVWLYGQLFLNSHQSGDSNKWLLEIEFRGIRRFFFFLTLFQKPTILVFDSSKFFSHNFLVILALIQQVGLNFALMLNFIRFKQY